MSIMDENPIVIAIFGYHHFGAQAAYIGYQGGADIIPTRARVSASEST